MISYLDGKLSAKHPTYILIDIGGVGYHVQIPLSSLGGLPPVGESVRILTHLHVREDIMALYGFATEAERELFEILIGVSGIGSSMALRILSGMSIVEFKRLVLGEDTDGLSRIKGIGKKTGQRLVLELKDRIAMISPEEIDPVEDSSMDLVEEATSALLGLGANPLQARQVVSQVVKDSGDSASVEDVIRQSLRKI